MRTTHTRARTILALAASLGLVGTPAAGASLLGTTLDPSTPTTSTSTTEANAATSGRGHAHVAPFDPDGVVVRPGQSMHLDRTVSFPDVRPNCTTGFIAADAEYLAGRPGHRYLVTAGHCISFSGGVTHQHGHGPAVLLSPLNATVATPEGLAPLSEYVPFGTVLWADEGDADVETPAGTLTTPFDGGVILLDDDVSVDPDVPTLGTPSGILSEVDTVMQDGADADAISMYGRSGGLGDVAGTPVLARRDGLVTNAFGDDFICASLPASNGDSGSPTMVDGLAAGIHVGGCFGDAMSMRVSSILDRFAAETGIRLGLVTERAGPIVRHAPRPGHRETGRHDGHHRPEHAHRWEDEDVATVGPGMPMDYPFNGVAGCTSGFVAHGDDGHRYMITAGHCLGDLQRFGEHGRLEGADAVVMSVGDVEPIHQGMVQSKNLRRIGEAFWFDQRAVTVQSPIEPNYMDGGIIRLDDSVAIDPAVPELGAPAGVATAFATAWQDGPEAATQVDMYGLGLVVGHVAPHRSGTVVGEIGGALVCTDLPVASFDSGAPLLTSDGQALGVLSFEHNSDSWSNGVEGEPMGCPVANSAFTSVRAIIDHFRDDTGITLRLATEKAGPIARQGPPSAPGTPAGHDGDHRQE